MICRWATLNSEGSRDPALLRPPQDRDGGHAAAPTHPGRGLRTCLKRCKLRWQDGHDILVAETIRTDPIGLFASPDLLVLDTRNGNLIQRIALFLGTCL